jgi:hypothetical protein
MSLASDEIERRSRSVFERGLGPRKPWGRFGLPRSAGPIELDEGSWTCPPPSELVLASAEAFDKGFDRLGLKH